MTLRRCFSTGLPLSIRWKFMFQIKKVRIAPDPRNEMKPSFSRRSGDRGCRFHNFRSMTLRRCLSTGLPLSVQSVARDAFFFTFISLTAPDVFVMFHRKK
jgi:hypothetical protein